MMVFDQRIRDDDLSLDNNGLVGNYTWTYDAGIEPGNYDLRLEITDVQGHVVVFQHVGIEFMEYGMYLSLPVDRNPIQCLLLQGKLAALSSWLSIQAMQVFLWM